MHPSWPSTVRKNVFGVEILDENLLTSLLFFVCGAGFDDVSCLRCATLDDLKEAGVLVGHARKILAAFGGSEEADAIETVVLEEQQQPQEQPEAEPEEMGGDMRQAWTDAPASPPLPAAAAAPKPATPAAAGSPPLPAASGTGSPPVGAMASSAAQPQRAQHRHSLASDCELRARD